MLKEYKEYEETNYDWLPLIPAHWEKKTIRSITKLSDKRCGARTDLELLSVYREFGVIKKKSRDDNHNVESEDLSNYKYVKKGSLVMNKMKMWQGSLGISDYDGIVSPAYIVCDLITDANLSYLQYLLRSPLLKTFYNQVSYGIRVGQWDMRYDDFKSLCLYLPPSAEQDQIVLYLDWKVSMINKYINAKKKQIELLKEQKQAVINQAVTKGLDSKVPMKDSGIEWLGKTPEHWEIRKLKRCCLMKSGINLTSYEIENEGRYPVYGGNGLRGYYKNYNRYGDSLLIGRQGALCGNIHKISGKFWATEHAVVVEPNKSIDINWYHYMLTFMNLNQYSESAAQPGLSVENIQNLKTCFPPLLEQKAIADYLKEKVDRIDMTVNNNENEMSLMQEYRTRLISDVVTGGVSVQGVKVPEIDVENEGVDNDG